MNFRKKILTVMLPIRCKYYIKFSLIFTFFFSIIQFSMHASPATQTNTFVTTNFCRQIADESLTLFLQLNSDGYAYFNSFTTILPCTNNNLVNKPGLKKSSSPYTITDFSVDPSTGLATGTFNAAFPYRSTPSYYHYSGNFSTKVSPQGLLVFPDETTIQIDNDGDVEPYQKFIK